MKKSKEVLKNKAGFTMAEVLIVVAIIAVLAAFGTIAGGSLIRSNRQRTLDKMAETIYLIAERNLQEAVLTGKYPLSEEGFVADNSINSEIVMPPETASDEIVNGKWFITYKSLAQDGNILSSHVQKVFCTTADNSYADSFPYDEEELKNVRGVNDDGTVENGDGRVGYYGSQGDADTLPSDLNFEKDRIYAGLVVENVEELGVGVYIQFPDAALNKSLYDGSYLSPKDVTYTLSITGVTSGAVFVTQEKTLDTNSKYAYQSASANRDCYTPDAGNNGGFYKDYVVLDNLSDPSKQFKNITDSSGIIPGEDIIIEINATCAGEKAIQIGDSEDSTTAEGTSTNGLNPSEWFGYKQTNSLFAERYTVPASGGTATYDVVKIAYGRHLQNLDAATSGMPVTESDLNKIRTNSGKNLKDVIISKLHVVLDKTIDFQNEDGPFNESWSIIYKDGGNVKAFTPIVNTIIDVFDGGATIDEATNEPKADSISINNLSIKKSNVDPRGTVSGTNAQDVAGLFGVFFGKEIKNVHFSKAALSISSEKYTESGILAGRTTEVLKVSNCYIDESSVSNNRMMVDDYAYGITGGFIGVCRNDVSFEQCKIKKSTIESKDQSWYTGGFVGATSEKGTVSSTSNRYSVSIKDCIVDYCDVHNRQSRAGSSAGGFIGYVNSKDIDISSSYVMDTKVTAYVGRNSSVMGGMVGWLMVQNDAKFTNCGVFLKERKIDECFIGSEGNSDGTNVAGGLAACSVVGKLTIDKCYSAMGLQLTTNNGTRPIGGLVGGMYSNFGGITGVGNLDISDSYADCYMNGTQIGGLLGFKDVTAVPSFTNSYSGGFVYGNYTKMAAGIAPVKSSVTDCYSLFNFDNVFDTSKFDANELIFDDKGYVSGYPRLAQPAVSTMKKYGITIDGSTVVNSFYTYGGDVENQNNQGEYKSIQDIVEDAASGKGKKTGNITEIELGIDQTILAKNAYEYTIAFSEKLKGDEDEKAVIPNFLPEMPHYGDWLERPGNQLWARVYKTSDNKYVMFFEKGTRKSIIPNTSTTLTVVGEWLADDMKELVAGETASVDSGFLKQKDVLPTDGDQSAATKEARAKLIAPWQYNNSDLTISGKAYKYGWAEGYNNSYIQQITAVTFDEDFCKNTKANPVVPQAKPLSMRNWFKNFKSMSSISGIKELDVSNVTSMKKLFFNCSSMTSYDLSTWVTNNGTTSVLTDTSYMFGNGSVDVKPDGTDGTMSNQDFDSGIRGNATSIILGDTFDTSNVQRMDCMFNGQRSLSGTLNLAMLNTQSATDISRMFMFCDNLQAVTGLEDFNVKNVTTMHGMFYRCNSFLAFDFSKWDTSDGKLTDIGGMLGGNYDNGKATASVKFGENFNTCNVTDMSWAFEALNKVTELDLRMFDTGKVKDYTGMFYNCAKLKTIYASDKFVTTSCESGKDAQMFSKCNALTGGCGTKWADKSGAKQINKTYAWIDGRNTNGITDTDEGYFYNVEYTKLWARIYEKDDDHYMYFERGPRKNYEHNDIFVTEWQGDTERGFLNKPQALINNDVASVWGSYAKSVVKIQFTDGFCDSAKPVNIQFWFRRFSKLTQIDGIQNLNLSNNTSLYNTFAQASLLKDIDVSKWDTSHITNMDYAFQFCAAIDSLDVSKWDTSNVTSMIHTFNGCRSVKILDVSDWDTSKVRSMGVLFQNCNKLSELDVSRWNTSSCTDMNRMFLGDSNLTSLDVSNFDVSKVTSFEQMFWSVKVKDLDVSGFVTSKAKTMHQMFGGCTNITELDLQGFDTSNVTVMQEMFLNCSKLERIYATEMFTTDKVTNSINMFMNCAKLNGGCGTYWSKNSAGNTDIDKKYAWIDGRNNPKNPATGTSEGYFCNKAYQSLFARIYSNDNGKYSLYFENGSYENNNHSEEAIVYWRQDQGNFYGLTNNTDVPWRCAEEGWPKDEYKKIEKVIFTDTFGRTERITSLTKWFWACSGLTSIEGLELLDTSNVTAMDSLFQECSNLTEIDVSNFDTSNVVTMSRMFNGCGITEINMTNFDTRKVTSMYMMFYSCRNLYKVQLGEKFLTNNVTNFDYFVASTKKLKTIDVSNFDTAKCKSMLLMFWNSGIKSIDISSFSPSSLTVVAGMFKDCSDLETIYVSADDNFKLSDSDVSEGSYPMFSGCTKLVGGSGTVYDSSHQDKEYARIDNPSGSPGYYTDKSTAVLPDSSVLIVDNDEGKQVLHIYDAESVEYYADETSYEQTGKLVASIDNCFFRNNGSEWDAYRSNIAEVVFHDSNELKPTSFEGWFKNCTALTTFDTEKALNTSEATSMKSMFEGCTGLTALDLSSFDVSKVTDMTNMFKGCSAITTITVDEFNVEAVTSSSDMFLDCTAIVGGATTPTRYDASHVDKEYARIDRGPGYNGYFTAVDGITEDEVSGYEGVISKVTFKNGKEVYYYNGKFYETLVEAIAAYAADNP